MCRVAWTIAHIPGGSDAPGPEPAFQVKAMGVGVSMRTAQPHRETPQFSGAQAWAAGPSRPGANVLTAAVPAQLKPLWHLHRLPTMLGGRHSEHKALALRGLLRPRGNASGHLDVNALEIGGQRR